MRTTTAIAAFVLVGSGAAGAAAIGGQYQGSDTQFQVTAAVLAAAGLTPANAYIGGGSGNAASAMTGSLPPYLAAHATQQTGPMSRMLTNEAHVCGFNSGTSGSSDTSASGIVLGLDAVAIWSAHAAGGAAACNGTADNTGYGLAYSGSSATVFGGGGTQNWKWILALLYGGKDYSNPATPADCGSAARQTLVSNWTNIFQSAAAHGCSNAVSQCSAAGPTKGGLWHAFRRDDASGTSDVFASILGLAPSTSASSVNGFGTSPYCNALNWDTSSGNVFCHNGSNDQWTGPGGIVDPASKCVIGGSCGAVGTGNHRRPPPDTWGDKPDSTQTTNSADVLPTQFQDNDPIRQTCLGSATNVHGRPGEEICNIDGKLGMVLPMPDTDWMRTQSPPLVQYPINNCNGWAFGKAPLVFTCAIRGPGTRHSGECPNGDALDAGGCMLPVDTTLNTSQCVATRASIAPISVRPLSSPDGRIYNLHMRDGTTTEPGIGYAQYAIPSLGSTLDMVGGYSRIHQVETVFGIAAPNPQACQLVDMTDQIGCLVQADPCSIGYAGAGAQTFALRPNGLTPAPGTPQAVDALRVAQIAPSTATVQALGARGEYQLARKLYLVSLPGFNNVAVTLGDPGATDELTLAQFEATPSNINPILTANAFFTLGAQSPGGLDTPFCEDFNEQVVCNPTPASPSGLPANVNGCTNNPLGIPTLSTTCGNGARDAYEECDNGLNNGTASNSCSQICRCVNDFNNLTGVCN
jgi:hypothetical protein